MDRTMIFDFRFLIFDWMRAHAARIIFGVMLGAMLAFAMTPAHAQTPAATLLPGQRAQWRFDYTGDNSTIRIAFNSPGAYRVTMEVFTPEQIAAMQRGEQPKPVGLGTPTREVTLFWSGAFRSGGTYNVIIDNGGEYPINYRLEIVGPGVSGAAQIFSQAAAPASNTVEQAGRRYVTANLSSTTNQAELKLPVPPEPEKCTRANQIPPVIQSSIKLCPGEVYPPLKIVGNNIALFGDPARQAIVTGNARQFAITAEGSNIWIDGITVQAKTDPKDLGSWLCQYDECKFATRPTPTIINGGLAYGGGILLKATNSTVHNVVVRGGTIGIATVDGYANNIVNNQLNDLNGWGSFNINSNASYFVGNQLDRNNHGCTTPDGNKYLNGCETAGWVCLACKNNVITRNRCELSGNCYYMSGERNLGSGDNKFIANYCAGATSNCFEITFSFGNLLQDNIATVEPKANKPCKYPFWIGGSVVMVQNNLWQCTIDPDKAFNESRDSTVVATNVINIDAFGMVQVSPLVSPTRVPTRTPEPTVVPLGARMRPGLRYEPLP
ncbi:MAG: right-handed parallel beta-helix repeat-containing protein [Chloroflexi bacterium]|nr:right-handed parallel beta-helix repeat-containing protein [Chloroflexota bacterium]